MLQLARAVRSHWGIENQVHWVVDGAFNEDASRIRKDHAPKNLALVPHLTLNLIRQESPTRCGIQAKHLKAGWENSSLARPLSSAGYRFHLS
ncbi:MAG: hypothetical protein VKJ02_08895 [Snowella sp.]|nr:hypothetical protein [Snowella sp.]